jgi:plastocyanin
MNARETPAFRATKDVGKPQRGLKLRRSIQRFLFCALGVTAIFIVVRPALPARAQTQGTFEVEIGQLTKSVAAESMAFYPSALKVHSGDIIHFSNEFGAIPETGVHGVLALPPGEEPREWELENASNLDGEWAFFQTDPDDDPGESPSALKGNWRTLLPTDLSCGTRDNPCITGTSAASRTPMNSGVSDPLDFSLKIEAEPGTRIWMICPIHTAMKMKVDVVADDEAVTTPEQIASHNTAKLREATEKAKRLDDRFSSRRTSVLRKDGTRLWDAWPGVDRGTVSLIKMYPDKLQISKGDSVKWHFEEMRSELHSVSFPLNDALDVHNAPWLTLVCDPDTDQGVAQDIDPLGGPCGPPSDAWEFDIHPRFYFPFGNRRMRGDEYESSGLRGAIAGISHEPFTMRFPQSSGPAPFDFGCQLHPTMRGSVGVR